jgi:hypothetical protein
MFALQPSQPIPNVTSSKAIRSVTKLMVENATLVPAMVIATLASLPNSGSVS